jgi:hypothetical protein
MTRFRKIGLAVGVTIAIVAAGTMLVLMPQYIMFNLESASPVNGRVVRGLAFKGSSPHPLDGTLRLYIGSLVDPKDDAFQGLHKRQTDIRFDRSLNILWAGKEAPDTFSIRSKDTVLMTWRVENDEPLCLFGKERLAPDPYKVKEASP